MMKKPQPFKPPLGENDKRALWSLREAGGHLRACGLYAEAKRVEKLADQLDPNEIKPTPIVHRTISA